MILINTGITTMPKKTKCSVIVNTYHSTFAHIASNGAPSPKSGGSLPGMINWTIDARPTIVKNAGITKYEIAGNSSVGR